MSRNCCPPGGHGGTELCQPTDLGINRCYGEGTVETCVPDGQDCAFADECCGGYCVPDATGAYVCGSECIDLAGACTSNADCCGGLECLGGICTPQSTECVPYAGECTTSDECCSGYCDPDLLLCLQILE
jgi:hypothetical protein